MRKFLHTAKYKKLESSFDSSERTDELQEQWTDFRCLIEPIRHSVKETALATIVDPKFTISWGVPELSDGDVVEWDGEPYAITSVVADVLRGRTPYYTAILQGTYL